MYTWIGILGAAAVLYGIIATYFIGRRHNEKSSSALDKGASMTTVRHPVLANPILILYVAVPIIALLLGMLAVYLTKS
ncbi:hypothetical protein [Paenibacillus sp. HB172176]|uniref:hypothetical protein n=1 Tax=Paenibacillus sp. HB172176 TaxID=2493690 RepID=UPI00143A9D25|nr:hypothetical protein [Paenibacillus sp. HB172176]